MSNFVEDENDAFNYGIEIKKSGNKKELVEATESAISMIDKNLCLMAALIAGYTHN